MQMSFTAQELFGMAYIQRKPRMYGIPNLMGPNPQKAIRETLDSLMEQGLATMDMDGKISLQRDYVQLLDSYCDCSRCLTVNLQAESAQSWIFWRHGELYMMAEVIADRYVFARVDADMVRAILQKAAYKAKTCEDAAEAVIPRMQLTKAQRFCSQQKREDAVRLLRQNGAGEEMAEAIADGLQKKAWYLSLLCMDMRQGMCEKTHLSYLASRDLLLELSDTIINLRSCTAFTPCQPETVKDGICRMTQMLLEKGGAADG